MTAELESLKEELPKREKIGALKETEGFRLAVEQYKEEFTEAINAEDKKAINNCKKILDLLIDFQSFLNTQQQRADRIPELISDIEYDLSQGKFW